MWWLTKEEIVNDFSNLQNSQIKKVVEYYINLYVNMYTCVFMYLFCQAKPEWLYTKLLAMRQV